MILTVGLGDGERYEMCGVLGSVDEIWGRGEELNSAGCYGGVDCVMRLWRSDLLFTNFSPILAQISNLSSFGW